MRVMVLVKATNDSEAGVVPSTELLEAMGRFNEELAARCSRARAAARQSASPCRARGSSRLRVFGRIRAANSVAGASGRRARRPPPGDRRSTRAEAGGGSPEGTKERDRRCRSIRRPPRRR